MKYCTFFENIPFEQVGKGVSRGGRQGENVRPVMNVLVVAPPREDYRPLVRDQQERAGRVG